MPKTKRLFRSNTNQVIGGVCAGLAEYFDIDPSIVRIIFVLAMLTEGFGLLLYIILWIVLPLKSSLDHTSQEVMEENKEEIKKKVKETTKSIKKEVKTDSKK